MSTVDDDYRETRKEIRAKDENLRLAATFGKQLLKEKNVINSKLEQALSEIERLEQRKYSLEMELKTQSQTVETLNSDLEIQTKENSYLVKKISVLEKEIAVLKQRCDNLSREKMDLETVQEDLMLENSSLKNKLKLLEQSIETFQNVTLNESKHEEEIPIINSFIEKIKYLEDNLSNVQCELDSTKLNEKRLNNLVKELEEAVADRDKELSSYSVEIKKEKEFSADLQCEIETLKLDQLDVNQRGNSMFAELDDRRKLVEKEFKLLSQKYDNVLKNYEDNKDELTRCKGQLVILQSMTSKKYQDSYIEKLENMLSQARRDKAMLNFKLCNLMKDLQKVNTEQVATPGDQYNYLRVMNQQAQQKVKQTENELISARMQIVNLENNLAVANRNLYISKKDFNDLKIENTKLKQEIKDITSKPDMSVPAKPKKNIEIMPGFENDAECQRLVAIATKENLEPQNQKDIIPGVLMLGEEGFVEVKAPRPSNIARLRNAKFNTKENEGVHNQQNKCALKECNEKINEVPEKCATSTECELSSENNKKKNNCAQQ